jgi:hypothetical protein
MADHPKPSGGGDSAAAAEPSSPTKLSGSFRSAASFRFNAQNEDLKKRVAELEAKLVEKESAMKNLPDVDKISQEMAVTKKNNEILQANVETLKALAIQLATQLEEANLQLATFKEKQHVAALQLERDVGYEIDTLRQDYENRLEELRRALEATQKKMKQSMDESSARELHMEQQLQSIIKEKDAMISSMLTQSEVLKEQLAQVTQREKELRLARTSQQRMRSVRNQREQATFAQLSDSGLTDDDLRSEAKNVLTLNLAVRRSEFEQHRRIRDVGIPPIRGGHHFHVDVASDPVVLIPNGEFSGSEQLSKPSLAMLAVEFAENPTVTGHTWYYTSIGGDRIQVQLKILSSASHTHMHR